MRRRVFLAALVGGMAAATTAQARDRADDILRELKRKGYRIEAVSRTLLGRTRILATKDGGRREIIVNPVTGEILRDLWIARGYSDADGGWDDWNGGGNGGEGKGGDTDDDPDDDDQDDDDDRDRDNSGKGSGDDD